MPGEWYGVSKMNEIFSALNEALNFSPLLTGNKLGKFKICAFNNGEIITKEVLESGLGKQTFENLIVEG